MRVFVGVIQGQDVYLDSDLNSDAIALITHQQDELERIKGVDADIAETMQRLIDRDN